MPQLDLGEFLPHNDRKGLGRFSVPHGRNSHGMCPARLRQGSHSRKQLL